MYDSLACVADVDAREGREAGALRVKSIRYGWERPRGPRRDWIMKRDVPPRLIIGAIVVAGYVFLVFFLSVYNTHHRAPVVTVPVATVPAAQSVSPTVTTDTLVQAPGTTQFSLERVNQTELSTPQTAPIMVARTSAVIIEGWAVDSPNNALAGGVIATVDDATSVRATYGSDRQDVADYFHAQALKQSGFTVTFPPGMLAVGKHSIAIKILTNDRRSYYVAGGIIQVDVV